jgi:signal transduction histidine kinase
MATLPYRTVCAPALLCLAWGNAQAATPAWELPAAVGAGLLWVAALATACCLLLRRAIDAEDQLQHLRARLYAEQKARADAEQALADTHDVLARLVLQQCSARDSERGRIARDIHDDLGQSLLALRIDVSLLQVATRGIHPAVHDKLGLLAGTLDHALRSLRAVINNLRPLALGEGLQVAMQRQVREFSRLSGIAHEFEADADVLETAQREPVLDVVLYRVLQESLSNVARHSHASLVRVRLAREDDRVALQVQDNGVGMAPDPVHYGCGLAGMRERISAAGGDLVIESAPNEGTLLALSLPLAHETVAR